MLTHTRRRTKKQPSKQKANLSVVSKQSAAKAAFQIKQKNEQIHGSKTKKIPLYGHNRVAEIQQTTHTYFTRIRLSNSLKKIESFSKANKLTHTRSAAVSAQVQR